MVVSVAEGHRGLALICCVVTERESALRIPGERGRAGYERVDHEPAVLVKMAANLVSQFLEVLASQGVTKRVGWEQNSSELAVERERARVPFDECHGQCTFRCLASRPFDHGWAHSIPVTS
ncbi:MAG: hypothetical protein CME19_09010 [Gemmatimonadetes bacterium]|nr:hypothetical protein [Gemmatimonadota bacterium]